MLLTRELLAWAGDHHGLVSLGAWTANGRSPASFRRCLRDGVLVGVAPGVAALPGRTVGAVERIAAGVLAFGPDVVVSHRSAAVLWGAAVPPDRPVDLVTRRRSQRTTVEGYVLHRPDDRAVLRSMRRLDLPVTPPLRTLGDVAAVDPDLAAGVAAELLRSRRVTAGAVLALCAASPSRGVVALRRAVDEVTIGGEVSDSELEATMARVFERAGLTGWVFHARLEGFEVDFCFRSERVVVEVDGWAFHGAARSQWERDRERDVVLAAAGWLVVRLTWRMVTRQPAAAIARLRAALAHRVPGSAHR